MSSLLDVLVPKIVVEAMGTKFAPPHSVDVLWAMYRRAIRANPIDRESLLNIANESLDYGRPTADMGAARLASMALQAVTGGRVAVDHPRNPEHTSNCNTKIGEY